VNSSNAKPLDQNMNMKWYEMKHVKWYKKQSSATILKT